MSPTRPFVDPALARRVRERLVAVPDFPSPGVLFQDLNPVVADASLWRDLVDAVAGRRAEWGFDVVAGLDARGFPLAGAVAYAAGVPLVLIRKAGKLPGVTRSVDYALEYGTARLELPAGVPATGDRVLLVDDVLATGGTLAAAASLVRAAGAVVAHCVVVVEIGELAGRGRIPDTLDALVLV